MASLILFINVAVGQHFEGGIIYSGTFKSKIPNLSDGKLEMLVGSKQQYFVKDGNYKFLSNGKAIVMQLYDHNTNRDRKMEYDTSFIGENAQTLTLQLCF